MTITVEELHTKWDDMIGRLIKAHGFRPSDIDDVKSELYIAWIAGNYQAIYDPTKSAPTTFIHHFVSTRLKGYRSKKKRDVLTKAVPLVSDLDSGRGILIDLIEGTPEMLEAAEVKVDEAGLEEELRGMTYKGYAGHTRDYYQIYLWLKEGKSQTEIAKLMEYSLGTTNALVKKVREVTANWTYKVIQPDPLDQPKKEDEQP